LENLETGILEFETVEELLDEIKKKFRGDNKELWKVAELKKIKQG